MTVKMCWILPFIGQKMTAYQNFPSKECVLKIEGGSREFPGSQIVGMLEFISVY